MISKRTNITLASPDLCTGCGACAQSCVKGAISMEEGAMGHLFPQINRDWCVECGVCEQHCPILHPLELHSIKNAYAAWAKDEDEYKTSVSGGVASTLSRYIIQQGGVVYGCAMLPNIEVKHIRVDSESDLNNLKGSKYVQSSIIEIIPQLKEDVKIGYKVLFIGTPCQVAAIKKLYKEQPTNLYLVDLVCHGVPSLQLLQNHIKNVAPSNQTYQYISFRSSEGFCGVVVCDKIETYRKPYCQQNMRGDWYIGTFLEGYTYRESCYNCQYAQPNRVGDITIGDFWGLGAECSTDNMDEHLWGCSVVLPSTEKGQQLVQEIAFNLKLYERPISEAVHGNSQLMHPTQKTNRIRLFRFLYSISNSLNWYCLCNLDRPLQTLCKKIIRKIKKLCHKK